MNAAAAEYKGRTALQAADIPKRLLTSNATVNAAAGYKNGRTELQTAAEGGYLEMVEIFLTAEAAANQLI